MDTRVLYLLFITSLTVSMPRFGRNLEIIINRTINLFIIYNDKSMSLFILIVNIEFINIVVRSIATQFILNLLLPD